VGIDLSPLVLIAAIYLVDYFVVATLHDLDARLH